MNISDKIREIAEKEKYLILAHNYQREEIKDVADFTGDSLELSRIARESSAEKIVFCGVLFMAETARILNPGARVFLPVAEAGCPMADMASAEDVLRFKKLYPDAAVCSYVNSCAEVKAVSDVCCTSANSVRIVNGLKEQEVIMLPDQNLAYYTAGKTSKKIIPYPGFCIVHKRFSADEIRDIRKNHPEALIISHPECDPDVQMLSDEVASTSGMIRLVSASDRKQIVIATEEGLIHQLRRRFPEKEIVSAGSLKTCINMKKTTMESLLFCLENETGEIILDSSVIEKAGRALLRMMELNQ